MEMISDDDTKQLMRLRQQGLSKLANSIQVELSRGLSWDMAQKTAELKLSTNDPEYKSNFKLKQPDTDSNQSNVRTGADGRQLKHARYHGAPKDPTSKPGKVLPALGKTRAAKATRQAAASFSAGARTADKITNSAATTSMRQRRSSNSLRRKRPS